MTPYGLGALPSPPDARDHRLSLYVATPAVLPAFHSSPRLPVLDQGQTSMCVGFSGALTRTIGERRDEHRTIGFDAADLYAHCKLIDGNTGEGTDMRSGCQVLQNLGAKESGSEVRRRIAAYARLISLDEMKTAILAFGAAWVAADWQESWFDPKADGSLPAPNRVAGGHAFTFIGWSDRRRAFRMQNSWGPNWAQHGRAWFPYAYINLAADFEAWQTIDVLGDR